MRENLKEICKSLFCIALGSAVYALGFDLFLAPHQFGAGGVSGLGVVVHAFVPRVSVGLFSVVVNVPLFLAGRRLLGKRFFWGSLAGMLLSSVLIDGLTLLPGIETEPLLGAVFGGLLVGAGCGIVFLQGASTGGTDIAAQLLKHRLSELPLGKLVLVFDGAVALITGLAFRDVTKVLYCLVALYVSSEAVDVVLYRFDFSYVAVIVTDSAELIRDAIDRRLERGCTYLKGEGAYTGAPKNVVYCALNRRQVAELKSLVMEIDPEAFLVLQEAHQVLGEGFGRYSK